MSECPRPKEPAESRLRLHQHRASRPMDRRSLHHEARISASRSRPPALQSFRRLREVAIKLDRGIVPEAHAVHVVQPHELSGPSEVNAEALKGPLEPLSIEQDV